MSNQLREIGEFIVFENPQLHDLQETGLMMPHHVVPSHQFMESGLMVAHDAREPSPEAALIEVGLMILHSAPALQNSKLQSFRLTNFSDRQGANLKKTSGQIS